jgi:hypothetical protein
MDKDAIQDSGDNCVATWNPNQANVDGDAFGDACDPCPNAADVSGAYSMGIPELGIMPKPIVPDADHDGIGDACDPTQGSV